MAALCIPLNAHAISSDATLKTNWNRRVQIAATLAKESRNPEAIAVAALLKKAAVTQFIDKGHGYVLRTLGPATFANVRAIPITPEVKRSRQYQMIGGTNGVAMCIHLKKQKLTCIYYPITTYCSDKEDAVILLHEGTHALLRMRDGKATTSTEVEAYTVEHAVEYRTFGKDFVRLVDNFTAYCLQRNLVRKTGSMLVLDLERLGEYRVHLFSNLRRVYGPMNTQKLYDRASTVVDTAMYRMIDKAIQDPAERRASKQRQFERFYRDPVMR